MVTEDKSLGLKIADNKEEAFWLEVKDRCEKSIENSKRAILLDQNTLKFCEVMIKQCQTKTH